MSEKKYKETEGKIQSLYYYGGYRDEEWKENFKRVLRFSRDILGCLATELISHRGSDHTSIDVTVVIVSRVSSFLAFKIK